MLAGVTVQLLPFGRLLYGEPSAISNAIGYAKFYSRSHDAVIQVYEGSGNVIETHEHKGDFKEREAYLRLPEPWLSFSLDGQAGHSTLLLQQAFRFRSRSLLYLPGPVRVPYRGHATATSDYPGRKPTTNSPKASSPADTLYCGRLLIAVPPPL